MKAPRTAAQIAASLRRTADDYHHSRITYEQLGKRNRRDWDEAAKSKARHRRVLEILRAS